MKRIYSHIVCLLFSCCTLAQDTIYELATPVIIDSFHQSFTTYNQIFTADDDLRAIYIGGPLSEALRFTASGNSRSSGPGKVTTFTKHGLPTEHTLVSWNNLELNSSLNGIVDFSTLPSFLLSSHSTLGEQFSHDIQLFSQTEQGATDILLLTGAYQQINAGIKHASTIGKSNINIGGEYIKSNNNILYTNDLNQQVNQVNGAYEQLHGIMGFGHQFNQRANLKIDVMYSDIKTQIPPTIFQKTSDAHQANTPFKIAANYAHRGEHHQFDITYGAIHEKLNYNNPSLSLDATHVFNRQHLELNWNHYYSSKTMIGIRLKETLEYGRSDNFSDRKSSVNSDIEAILSKSWNDKIVLSATLGILHGRSTWSPLNYSMKATCIANQHNRIRFSVKSLFRLPTYNELYWEPGGNRGLKPESGNAAVLDYFYSSKFFQVELGASLHRLNNRILWLPQNAGYFSPTNIGKIGSEELYGGITWTKIYQQYKFSTGIRYTYLHAHIVSSPTTQVEGNDIPFTPRHAINQHLSVTWNNKWTIKFLAAYQSKSYISTDNGRYLNQYFLLDSELRYRLTKKQLLSSLFIRINNITNTSYFLTSGYPQAERNWQLGLILRFKQKQHE